MSYWQNTLHHSQKLEFFRSFKSDHTTSNYLDLTRGTAEIKKLVNLKWAYNLKEVTVAGKCPTSKAYEE